VPDLSTIILSGSTNPWLYLPIAVLLGALHALEPGHSKALMAGFIVAIRGTNAQAVLLGVSAAIGHTLIVFGLALLGLYLGDKLILDKAEPWLVLASGVLIIVLALRLLFSLRAPHHHGHDHDHHHHDHHHHEDHGHEDAHARAHAQEIEARFAGRQNVSAVEVAWFGFTGGLLPCPAAIAVLLVCLQLKAFTLGLAMVGAFSLGLAITLVTVGLAAAWGTRRAAQSWSGFGIWAARLPYLSGGLVLALGIFITLRGLWALGVL
jgi:nickel/cobalt transporter (NicO) family protein